MIKITNASTGATVTLTEGVTFVREDKENACLVLCEEPEAQGIAHAGTTFSLLGREAIDGTETVMLDTVDAGAQINDMQTAIDDLVIASLEGGIGNV